eukprot:3748678-Pyramimonas_sp.AAC.1
MDIRASVWREKWSDESLGIERIAQLLSTARDNAKATPIPVFARGRHQEYEGVIGGRRRTTWEKKDLVWLPGSGKQGLVYFFQPIEQEAAWPWQLAV